MSDPTARPADDEPAAETRPQTIVLADDDAAVRHVAATILQKHGYSVLNAENGNRAVEVFAASRPRAALVVLDQRMPGPGLEVTLASLWAIESGARVLLMSGLTEPELPAETRRLLRGFVGKPFRGGELLRAVESALSGP
jgi:DNA-binding NtrC family response regulator